MKSRQVNFYVELEQLPSIVQAVIDVIPEFEKLPHFLGATVIKADEGSRAEVVMTSFWDDGLEGSEEASLRFGAEVNRISGSHASRRRFETLYAVVRESSGDLARE